MRKTCCMCAQGMGAAAWHSNSAEDACSLVQTALDLLPLLQAEEGDLAGDDLAEVLVLKQLGTLGEPCG
jgi:hypothetical protein